MHKNIAWAHKSYYLEDKRSEGYAQILLQVLSNSLGGENLQQICDQFDGNYNLEIGSALNYLRFLIGRKKVTVNMEEKEL